jgi:uncharacterized protein (DUF58 family)
MLWLVALVLTPAFTLMSLGGALFRVGLVLSAIVVACVFLDAVTSLDRLQELRIETEETIHAIVGRPFEIVLTVCWKKFGSLLTLRFDVPSELEDIRFPKSICFDERATSQRVVAGSRLLERGRVKLSKVNAETLSVFGFWLVRRGYEVDTMVLGYPDLHRDRRALVAHNFAKDLGAMASRLVGRGREFDRLRDYVPGDELDDVHWRATAKRRKLTTKLFQVERDQRIYVAIDQSRLCTRPSPREWPEESEPLTLLERYINTALVLGQVAQMQGDQFGLLGFDDTVSSFTPAGTGPIHYRACREAVLGFFPRRVNADYRELFSFFASKVRRRSMLFVLTSVDDPALCEELIESIKIIAERHLVVIAAVSPVQACSLADAEPIARPEEITERLAAHLVWKRQKTTALRLGKNGVRYLSLEHQSMVPRLVHCYARIKQGQNL